MTAALLIQQGRLAFEDDIRKYLPEIPNYGTAITVRHLIHHTSGLREYLTAARPNELVDNQRVLEITSRQPDLLFKPGDRYSYSNTGYGLLAIIVERQSGMRFSQFMESNVACGHKFLGTQIEPVCGRVQRHHRIEPSRRAFNVELAAIVPIRIAHYPR